MAVDRATMSSVDRYSSVAACAASSQTSKPAARANLTMTLAFEQLTLHVIRLKTSNIAMHRQRRLGFRDTPV
jgi:hypothetical protein